MTAPDQPEGAPGERPSIDYERNIREWHEEVRGRIRRMVIWSLAEDRPVAERYLRKLGPDGRAAFQRALNAAIDRRIAALTPAPQAEAEPASADDLLVTGTDHPPRPAGRFVVPVADWSAQRCERPSLAVRARRQGWAVAAVLVAVAAAWLHQQVYR